MLGQVLLGKYRVSRLLDQGGMCKIWLARQLGTPREVVVKVLQEQFLSQSKPRDFLRREIHILSRFQHAHAVAYVDAAPNHPDGPVLVMEYLNGLDLSTLLHREGRLTPERAGRLLVQLCDALGAAHQAGIVHRDLKPGNLMVLNPYTPQESLKLMDFGLAKMTALFYIGADDLVDFSLPAACGTPEYLAPEQARGQDVEARGDLYSAGVVLYEMLTGRRPFEYASTDDLLQAHVRETPPTFAERGVTDVAPEVEMVVRACLAKHSDDRPRDAAELAQRYEDALGKRLTGPRRGSSGLFAVRQSLASSPSEAPRVPSTPVPSADPNALRQDFEADMPEAMALLKLKGFLHDLGSEVVESLPGLIRVRLREPQRTKKSGLFALIRRDPTSGGVQLAAATELELRMARPDPGQPSLLHITLIMRSGGDTPSLEWRTRCQQIGRDLKAYLMGTLIG